MWLNLFYYLQCFRNTGPYVRTIIEVFFDMLGFLGLYLLTLTGFSHAFFMAAPAVSDMGNATAGTAMLKIWQMTYRMGTLGDFEADDFEDQWNLYFLFWLCILLITIMFLNVTRMDLNLISMSAVTRDPH